MNHSDSPKSHQVQLDLSEPVVLSPIRQASVIEPSKILVSQETRSIILQPSNRRAKIKHEKGV